MNGGPAPASSPLSRVTERSSSRPWTDSVAPDRVLLIRFHAFGDVAIVFPYAAAFRSAYPSCSLDLLTGEPTADLARASGLFAEVRSVPRRSAAMYRFSDAVRAAWQLRRRYYDAVVDLQRNTWSRLIRRMCAPPAWSEFDRFSPRSAALRVADAFEDAGFPSLAPLYSLRIPEDFAGSANRALRDSGWNGSDRIIVLNPAGLFPSRHWPLASYVALARILSRGDQTRFLILGTERVVGRAGQLRYELGDTVIDLSGRTSAGQALAALRLASAVVTEDSGLMHMAWASGIPTLALFGSSYHVWSAPVGQHCHTLHSGDLPCGACMDPVCRFGDTHCLTRWTPEHVAEILENLLRQNAGNGT